MERRFAKNDTVTWCDGGYGWAYEQKVDYFFGAVVVFIIVPWFVARIAPALAERIRLYVRSWNRGWLS